MQSTPAVPNLTAGGVPADPAECRANPKTSRMSPLFSHGMPECYATRPPRGNRLHCVKRWSDVPGHKVPGQGMAADEHGACPADQARPVTSRTSPPPPSLLVPLTWRHALRGSRSHRQL